MRFFSLTGILSIAVLLFACLGKISAYGVNSQQSPFTTLQSGGLEVVSAGSKSAHNSF